MMKPTNPNAYTYSKIDGKTLLDTLVGSCGELSLHTFWATLVGHSCETLLSHTDIPVGHSCRTCCGRVLWDTIETIVGHCC